MVAMSAKKRCKRKTRPAGKLYSELGAFLKEQRLKARLTQREVAASLGYSSAQFISNFECGRTMPPLKKLHIMVEIYSIPIRELMEIIMRVERKRIVSGLRGGGAAEFG